MIATKTAIPDVLILEPKIYGDDRGYFFESYNENAFRKATGLAFDFVQDNHSKSSKHVLRGLHYQLAPRAQGKLIRVVSGAVFDVAVDIRKHSPTYGRWIWQFLSGENRRQLWIPPGLAHGFLTLSDTAEFLYKTTDYYSPEHERCIAWNDPDLAIAWPSEIRPILSAKDSAGLTLRGEHLAFRERGIPDHSDAAKQGVARMKPRSSDAPISTP